MKNSKLFPLSVTILSFFTISCINYDEPIVDYTAWKLQNETYFSNMKDSTGYVLYRIPIAQGGSSFYYKIKLQGSSSGSSPLRTDYVKVNYRGKMNDGQIFEQTYTTILPDSTAKGFTFKADKLIQGWTENLIQMKVGEIRTIVIPQELGYGASGAGSIRPYTTLVFDIQLISFSSVY